MSRADPQLKLPRPGERIGTWLVEDAVTLEEPWIYRALHHELGTPAQIEIRRRSTGQDRHDRAAEAMRVLDHPVLPRLLAFGTEPERDLVWIATEPFDGERLSDMLLTGPLDWKRAARLFHRIASALAQVHAHSLVHRDVNPTRIRVGLDDTVRLEGFGLALDATAAGRSAEAPLGDMSYIAPEVIADPNHHAARADLYSLGCVLHEALTGRAAFPAAAWGEKADPAARMLEWKTRTAALDPGEVAPPWLRSLVRKATDPSSDKRLPDMEAFIGWLDAAAPTWKLEEASVATTDALPAPPIVRARPSIAPPDEEDIIDIARHEAANHAPPVALAYMAAAALGAVTGLAFTALVILFVETV